MGAPRPARLSSPRLPAATCFCTQTTPLRPLRCRAQSPRDGWRFGLGGRTGVSRASTHWLDNLRVTVGALLASTPAAVEVSLNAQQYTSDGVQFTYLGEPHVTSVFPVGGPTDGGTYLNLTAAVPANFDGASEVRCAFNSTELNISESVHASWDGATLACRAPAVRAPGRVLLRATMVKHRHALDYGDGVPYTFYAPPVVELFEPDSGPVAGATRLVLYGDGFSYGIGPYWCRLAGARTPATMTPHLGVLRCATPPVNSSVQVPVYVSLNGQQYSPSLPSFDFYEPPRVWSISPASGTMLGGVLVTVTGFSFQRSFRNLCRCGATRLPYPELATPIPYPNPTPTLA